MHAWRVLTVTLLLALLAACAGKDRRDDGEDGAPPDRVDASGVADAVPRPESRSRYGNGPRYEVWGKTYTVLPTSSGYRERGIASWYGTKFHGRPTSSGEPFDMYKATAAHRSLPLPTYAEVTNLDNGRRVTVKINDRGPFHSERLIDLSYGAALRLGIVEQGTGRVEVRAITFDDRRADASLPDDTYLQAGAFKSRSTARDLAKTLEQARVRPVDVDRSRGLYKVLIGPFRQLVDMEDMATRVVELGFERPHTVRR